MMNYRKIDLHMHTTASDGTDTPEELLEQVRKAEIELFAVTDHDTADGYKEIRKTLRAGDPQLVSGVEFSCKDEIGKYHILGYHFDPEHPAFRQVETDGHRFRMEKITARIDFLRDRFGFVFPEEEIRKLLHLQNPGKPHIGNLMVKYGYAPTKDEAISRYINQLHMNDEYIRPEEAIRGILGAGGIPVLAHPIAGSGDEWILGEELDERVRRLAGYGLQGLEAYYSGFPPKMIAQVLGLAEKYRLYVTAGSDYHGRNKMIAPGFTYLDEAETIPEGMIRFLEQVLDC